MSDRLVTQAEYARHRGKSRQYISRLARAGVLVMRGGKVDVAASDAVLDDRPEPVSERVAAAGVASPGTTFAQARAARTDLAEDLQAGAAPHPRSRRRAQGIL